MAIRKNPHSSADRTRRYRRRIREGVLVLPSVPVDGEGLRRWLQAEGVHDADPVRGYRRLVQIMCRPR